MINKLWKNWFLLVLGFFVMALPYLGFTRGVKNFLSIVAGLCIVGLSFMLARQNAHEDAYSEGRGA